MKLILSPRQCWQCDREFSARSPEIVHCSARCGTAWGKRSPRERIRARLHESQRIVIDRHGYVRITGQKPWLYEHRVVMEIAIGRPLTSAEAVHHLNGDKTDNRIENLELMTRSAHTSLHNHTEPKRARKSASIVHYPYTHENVTVAHSVHGDVSKAS